MTERKLSQGMYDKLEGVRLSLDALRAIGKADAPPLRSLAEMVAYFRANPPVMSAALRASLGITKKDEAA